MLQPVRGEVRKVLNRGAEMSIVLCGPLRHPILRRGNIYKMHGEAVNGSNIESQLIALTTVASEMSITKAAFQSKIIAETGLTAH